MIHLYISLFLLSLCCSCQVSAGGTRIVGKFKGMEQVQHHHFTLRGLDTTYVIKPGAEAAFELSLPENAPFYLLEGSLLMGDRSNKQLTSPLYVKRGETLKIEIDLAAAPVVLTASDANNRSMQEFRKFAERKMQEFLFDKIPNWNNVEEWVDSYRSEAQELIKAQPVDEPVADFLNSWRQV